VGRADSWGAGLGRAAAVAAAAALGGRNGGSGSRSGCVGAGAGAGAFLVLVDDKVDKLVAVAVNVQVVNRHVAAAVAVDVAGVAVRDDAAGVRLADGETGGSAVEEAVLHAGASIVRQVGDMGWVSENGNGRQDAGRLPFTSLPDLH